MTVIWHDVECGAYVEDLALWRSLAAEHGDPVLLAQVGERRRQSIDYLVQVEHLGDCHREHATGQ